jgi:hypothetical protein
MERRLTTILAADAESQACAGYTPLMDNNEAGAFRRGGPSAGGMT